MVHEVRTMRTIVWEWAVKKTHFRCRWPCVFLIIGLLIAIGLLLDVTNSEIPPVLQGLHNPPLGCHMRLYTYRITQTDDKGGF